MKNAMYAGFTIGLVLFIGLIVYQGIDEIAAALAVAGWGLVVVVLFHLVPMTVNTLGWRVLLEVKNRPLFGHLFMRRWIGEAINALLPVAQVGGEVVKARLIMRCGLSGDLAGASVIADFTVGLFAQVVFTLTGLFLLVYYFSDSAHAWGLFGGVIVFLLLFVGFYAAQRSGLFSVLAQMIERLGNTRGSAWMKLSGSAQAMDVALNGIYQRNASVVACGMWRLLGWMVGVGEIWLALYFMGEPISLLEALLLESLGQAVRAAAFLVPGALGVQEGGFILLGGIIGLGAETALALSLIKRVRELALGLPALAIWQFTSRKSAFLHQDGTP
ncbi:MAG: flippase-like domain-containing protein [Mariprofundaceae bacterium]